MIKVWPLFHYGDIDKTPTVWKREGNWWKLLPLREAQEYHARH